MHAYATVQQLVHHGNYQDCELSENLRSTANKKTLSWTRWRFSWIERLTQSMLLSHPNWLRSPRTSNQSTSCICHRVPSSHSRNDQNSRQHMTRSKLLCHTSIIRSYTLVRAPSSSSIARPGLQLATDATHDKNLFPTIFWWEFLYLFHFL